MVVLFSSLLHYDINRIQYQTREADLDDGIKTTDSKSATLMLTNIISETQYLSSV
jgi:hypothetical protein